MIGRKNSHFFDEPGGAGAATVILFKIKRQ
jgi:hypothetical protein